MPEFALAHTDDPVGLATAGDIVLTDFNEDTQSELIDILSELAVPVADSAKLTKTVVVATTSYELKSSNLVIALGTTVGSNGYRLQSLSGNWNSEGYPTINCTWIKPVTGTFQDTPGTYPSLTLTGGYGMVYLAGATCTDPESLSLNISSSQGMAVAGTSGLIMTQGLVLYAYRSTATMTGFSSITIPTGAKETSSSAPGGRELFAKISKGWTAYLSA